MTLLTDGEDPVLGPLPALPSRDVSPRRAEDIRRRCERELTRRARRRGVRPEPRRLWRLVFESAAVVGLSTLFLIEVARRAASLY